MNVAEIGRSGVRSLGGEGDSEVFRIHDSLYRCRRYLLIVIVRLLLIVIVRLLLIVIVRLLLIVIVRLILIVIVRVACSILTMANLAM